jgi:amidase
VDNTTGTELWRLGASELAAAIRAHTVSSREVIEAHLARIEAANAGVNAITRVLTEDALQAADQADQRSAVGETRGPLHGVPFTVKENIDVAGSPTTQGVAALAEAVPVIDAPQIANLRDAGAIPIARTNLPDFGLRWHTDNALYGPVRNPWDPSRTPGGSSGGDAAALAVGMTPLGVANDLGGSIRWPAQCTGVCALKPTPGRIPYASVIQPTLDPPISIQLMLVQGPMARHVRDLRVAAESMIQPSYRDPFHVPLPLTGEPPRRPVRVAVVVDPAGGTTCPQVAAGVKRAAQALADAGYLVEEFDPPQVAQAAELWPHLLAVDLRLMWPNMSPIVSEGARRSMQSLFDSLPEIDADAYMRIFVARRALCRAWASFQAERPLVLAPVCTEMPFAVDADLTSEGVSTILPSMRMVVAVNLLGLPAAAVPTGIAAGLPQEVQVIGPRFREDLCLDAAQAIEDACGVLAPI